LAGTLAASARTLQENMAKTPESPSRSGACNRYGNPLTIP
jgi:hypothetical protein